MSFKIIPNKKIWLTLSSTLVLASIILFFTWGLYLGIDFTGGSALTYKVDKAIAVDELNPVLSDLQQKLNAQPERKDNPVDFGDPIIVPNQDNSYTLKIKTIDDATHKEVLTAIQSKFPGVSEQSFMTIGPTIGQNLKDRALIAMLIALVGMIAYIAFAFRKVPKKVSPWKFGAAAILALFHDVIIVVGVFVLLGHFMHIEVGAMFVTAILTILGYSVNDTIVIFDRIRENMLFQNKGETFEQIAERSIWESFHRSINTSMTLFITLVVLFFFGAESIRWFIFALIIGVFFGTYSSIFVASPLLVIWKNKGTK